MVERRLQCDGKGVYIVELRSRARRVRETSSSCGSFAKGKSTLGVGNGASRGSSIREVSAHKADQSAWVKWSSGTERRPRLLSWPIHLPRAFRPLSRRWILHRYSPTLTFFHTGLFLYAPLRHLHLPFSISPMAPTTFHTPHISIFHSRVWEWKRDLQINCNRSRSMKMFPHEDLRILESIQSVWRDDPEVLMDQTLETKNSRWSSSPRLDWRWNFIFWLKLQLNLIY